jgi:predicted Zn finger-like uncharacterized protein
MVIKCAQCKGLMRVEESRIPAGGGVKVRCPHCSETGYVPARDIETARETKPVPGDQPASGEAVPSAGMLHQTPAPETAKGADGVEPSVPEDAFRDFRFPAERQMQESVRAPFSRRTKILIWAAVSLAVVALFALLVNLVLPGPSGTRPFGSTAPETPHQLERLQTPSIPEHAR